MTIVSKSHFKVPEVMHKDSYNGKRSEGMNLRFFNTSEITTSQTNDVISLFIFDDFNKTLTSNPQSHLYNPEFLFNKMVAQNQRRVPLFNNFFGKSVGEKTIHLYVQKVSKWSKK